MSKGWKVLLVLIAVGCFAVALSYPIRYSMEKKDTDQDMARLAAIRQAGLQRESATTATPEETQGAPDETENATENVVTRAPEQTIFVPGASEDAVYNAQDGMADAPEATNGASYDTQKVNDGAGDDAPVIMNGGVVYDVVEVTPSPSPTIAPTPTPDRRLRTKKAQPYPEKEKVILDEADILPEFQELYEINDDLVGWISIPGTVVDYPVVQSANSEFYLKHDFYGEKNSNGQIILDAKCDPYTPSYNLVVSGHNMKSGRMFGDLVNYMYESYWKKHKTLQMDVLTEHREYVAFAAFFSADYDVDEEGFRYNVDIQYELDMRKWLEEIRANQLYETGIEVEFGDEFLTLTTCNHWRRKDGRFVLVCRRIREGEEIE